MLLLAIPPFFLMHFREAKLPVHVHVERVVGGSSLPQILKEPKHLKHIDVLINLQVQYRAKATQNILCAQTRLKLHYDKKHNTNSIVKVGDKVLKSNARNRHRMGSKLEKPWLGVYIIQKDLVKGRYCLKALDGKPLKQTIHCARLKCFLDPVVDDNIVDEVKELDNMNKRQLMEKVWVTVFTMKKMIMTRSKDVRLKNSKVIVQSSVK